MTAPTLDHASVEHPGPAAVRAALDEIGSGIANWDRMLDLAYAKAQETGSLDPVEAFLAKSWRTVQIARNGMAPAGQRVTQEAFAAHVEERNRQAFPNTA